MTPRELAQQLRDHIGDRYPSLDDPTRDTLIGYVDELLAAALADGHQVDDDLAAFDRAAQALAVGHVAPDELRAPGGQRGRRLPARVPHERANLLVALA